MKMLEDFLTLIIAIFGILVLVSLYILIIFSVGFFIGFIIQLVFGPIIILNYSLSIWIGILFLVLLIIS